MQNILLKHGEIEYEILPQDIKRIVVAFDVRRLYFKIPRNHTNITTECIKDYIDINYLYFKNRISMAKNIVEKYISQYGDNIMIFDRLIPKNAANIDMLSDILLQEASILTQELSSKMELKCPSLQISYAKGYIAKCLTKKNIVKIDYRNTLCTNADLSYVIVHELSHFVYPNHSKAFWNHVEKYYPQCKLATKSVRKKINDNIVLLGYFNLLPDKYKNITQFRLRKY